MTPVAYGAGNAEIGACSGSASAGAGYPELPIPVAQLRQRVLSLKDRFFPDLKGLDPRIEVFQGGTDFLRANLRPWTAFLPADRREYLLQVNQALLADPPPPLALDAILVHELTHLRDYRGMSPPRLVWFGLKYFLFPITAYERQTDENALKLGQACGLIAYRRWLYAHEQGAALVAKRRDYYTPEEILAWLRSNR
ncbi:MAG: hypothetical protein P4M08_08140 [Oligoflexia bacterium]|nr:hypothetical protein [Oligoflexia bacterium]